MHHPSTKNYKYNSSFTNSCLNGMTDILRTVIFKWSFWKKHSFNISFSFIWDFFIWCKPHWRHRFMQLTGAKQAITASNWPVYVTWSETCPCLIFSFEVLGQDDLACFTWLPQVLSCVQSHFMQRIICLFEKITSEQLDIFHCNGITQALSCVSNHRW